ncbi:MAG: hypothetical protein ACK5V3_16340 [Bdellovibrionales bacterium]
MKTNETSHHKGQNPESALISHDLQTQSVSHYQVYHELSDLPVVYKSLEEEFVSRLALVEDLHRRFHFMVMELQSSGLRAEDDK